MFDFREKEQFQKLGKLDEQFQKLGIQMHGHASLVLLYGAEPRYATLEVQDLNGTAMQLYVLGSTCQIHVALSQNVMSAYGADQNPFKLVPKPRISLGVNRNTKKQNFGTWMASYFIFFTRLANVLVCCNETQYVRIRLRILLDMCCSNSTVSPPKYDT